MTAARVSVIIVSRDRPDALALCLLGLKQQYFDPFEIVVVADHTSCAALRPDWEGQIKILPFSDRNISAARNLGIGAAAGKIVAFIDDDAVAEPTWLARLCAPLIEGKAHAAGGFVLGRNGISLQWGARDVSPDGSSGPLALASDPVSFFVGTAERGAKTEGTNMAFDKATLMDLGGFDPALRFYMDETDVNMRMAKAGLCTAIVPGALVHHGYAASLWRRVDRVPRTLVDIGASLAVFLRKHAPADRWDAVRASERKAQRARLLRHMVAGRLEPRDIALILAGFDDGWSAGMSRAIGQPGEFGSPLMWVGMTPFSGNEPVVLSGLWHERSRLFAQAARSVQSGQRATVHVFSRTALFHRQRFSSSGYWIQTGGLYGRSLRTDPLFRSWRLGARSRREWAQVAEVRSKPLG